MNDFKKDVLMGFTKEHFPESNHVCLIFDSEEQRQKIVSEYLAVGLRQGERVRFFVDVTSPEEVRSWLLEMGIELPEANENEPFSTAKAESFYCKDGRFEPHRMIDGMIPRFDLAKKAGYSGMRSCGEMTWALKGFPGSDRLVEYEALLNTVTGTYPHTGMCLYDARLFDGATLFKILQVHPYMVAQGQIVKNPFYVRPEEFQAELNSGK
jgi:hypothetical protein